MDRRTMMQFMVESAGLLGCRAVLGDARTAELIFEQDYDADFVSRHPHQLSSLFEAYVEKEYE